MPSQRPCAAFEPISPDLDIASLVESTPNFDFVPRIHCDMIDVQGKERFERFVLLHVVIGGKPLVVEGYNEHLDRRTFSLEWLKDNCGTKPETARDLTKKTDMTLTIGHYINNMAILTDQWTPQNYKDPQKQRLYLKDIDCPRVWHDKLFHLIPPGLFYLNESTADQERPDALADLNTNVSGLGTEMGIAKAGDLMSSLPPEMRAENMMCYIGHEGTYTPAHREMCASLGHNIMVETSTDAVENGKKTKPGSSVWFMTESKDRHLVSEYWLSRLGHDIEVENHFAQINAWKAAPFDVYVVEQQVGDFILIPPLAPHQVWNRGTRTIKAAWNRTTVETLGLALDEALPATRMVCRDEQYKNKAIVYYTLVKYSKLIEAASQERSRITATNKGVKPLPAKIRQLQKDFKRLHALYTTIMVSECFLLDSPEKNVEVIPYDSNITCSYCRCNIFNRFLTCPSCISDLGDGEQDTYDICMECYAMGRSCACISNLKWVEQFDFSDLVQKHEAWRRQIIQFEDKGSEQPPEALQADPKLLGRRTLAQICQIELRKRPWNDINQPDKPGQKRATALDGDAVIEVDDEGRVKKRKMKFKKSKQWSRGHNPCHSCCSQEPTWKQAHCSCGTSYCYGSLFRGFDMMPQTIMEDLDWKCPKCLKICTCTKCRRDPENQPSEPSGTILGHDTKKIADPRSVESLVDFSYSNIHWLKKAGDDDSRNSRRLVKKAKAAAAAKSQEPSLGEDYVSDEDAETSGLAEQDSIIVGPPLGVTPDAATEGPHENESRRMDDLTEQIREHPEQAFSDDSLGILPPMPQYVVPEGGLMRDLDNVYNPTDAITYDYPEPDDAFNGVQSETTPQLEFGMGQPDHEVGLSPMIAEANEEINMVPAKRRKRHSDGAGPGKEKKTKRVVNITPSPKRKAGSHPATWKIGSSNDRLTDRNSMFHVRVQLDGPAMQELNGGRKGSIPFREAQTSISKRRTTNIPLEYVSEPSPFDDDEDDAEFDEEATLEYHARGKPKQSSRPKTR